MFLVVSQCLTSTYLKHKLTVLQRKSRAWGRVTNKKGRQKDKIGLVNSATNEKNKVTA